MSNLLVMRKDDRGDDLVTDHRKSNLQFSELAYYTANSITCSQEDSKIDSLWWSKRKRTISVKNGTSSQNFLEENQRIWLQDQNFSDGASMYDSLNSGSVAAIMDGEPVIKYADKQGRKFKALSRKLQKLDYSHLQLKRAKILNWLKCSIT